MSGRSSRRCRTRAGEIRAYPSFREPLSQRAPEAATCASRSPTRAESHLASFRYRAPLVEGSVVWERLTGEPEDQDVAISALFIADDAKASVYALAEESTARLDPGSQRYCPQRPGACGRSCPDSRTGHRCGADHRGGRGRSARSRRPRRCEGSRRRHGRASGVAGARARSLGARRSIPRTLSSTSPGSRVNPRRRRLRNPSRSFVSGAGRQRSAARANATSCRSRSSRRPLDEPGWSPDAGRRDGAPDAICRAAAHGRPGDRVQEAPRAREASAPATKSTAAGCSAPSGRPWSSMPISACFTGPSGKPGSTAGRDTSPTLRRVLAEARYLVFEGAAGGEGFSLLAGR